MTAQFDKNGIPCGEDLIASLGTSVTENERRKFYLVCKTHHISPGAQLRKIFRQWMDTYATGDF